MNPFTFHTTPQITAGPGSLKELGALCGRAGCSRPLVITDAGIEKLGLPEGLQNVLASCGIESGKFSGVVADPPERIILEAVEEAKSFGADGIIGFGGGSSMDTAKLVALLANSGERLADIYGVNNVKGKRLPLILIPTTAGTGSEVTSVAVVTTGETTKMGVVDPELFPDAALLDAELTLGLPAPVTAVTGVDAMVHAVEAYTSRHKKNPLSDMLAGQALRLLSQNIETACADGGNLEARQNMLLGACLAGQAFANAPVAAVHALAYPLGGHYHLAHGLTNALVLPHVLTFNAEEPSAADLYAELCPFVLPGVSDAGAFKEYFVSLLNTLKIPARLRDLDIPESDLPMLAEDAMKQQRLLVNNPRELSAGDALVLYRNAY